MNRSQQPHISSMTDVVSREFGGRCVRRYLRPIVALSMFVAIAVGVLVGATLPASAVSTSSVSTADTTVFAESQTGTDWNSVASAIEDELRAIPDYYAAGNATAIQDATRRAYYEHYQVSGLEQQIQHRLSDDLNDAFVADLLSIRKLAVEPDNADAVREKVNQVVDELHTNVAALLEAPEVTDQWARVAERIGELLDDAAQRYGAGDYDGAYNSARDAYLAHYEADGIEKATISYLGQGRVNDLEGQFQSLRRWARDHSVSADEYAATAQALAQSVAEDGHKIDEMTSSSEGIGWTGFFAAFLILLREGAEALLVVAALTTFALKAGRRDQLIGIIGGVIAALVVSALLAVVFSVVAATALSGLSQELLEGITGLLAVVMLVWVAIWMHGKSDHEGWTRYIAEQAGTKVLTGGVFALSTAAFLAVLREGSETILFFAPILVGAKSVSDYMAIIAGIGAAIVVLAIMFLVIRQFGMKLPMSLFFSVMAILIATLAVTILGGAIKELQDATVMTAHPIEGVPTVSILGLYPTVETLAAQAALLIIFFGMWLMSRRGRKDAVVTTDFHPQIKNS